MVEKMFAMFWNALSGASGKRKIRTEREAQDFLRKLAQNSVGPNEKIMQMRREYESVNAAKKASDLDRTHKPSVSAI